MMDFPALGGAKACWILAPVQAKASEKPLGGGESYSPLRSEDLYDI